MVYPQRNFASNFTLYSDILKGVINILKSTVLVKDRVYLAKFGDITKVSLKKLGCHLTKEDDTAWPDSCDNKLQSQLYILSKMEMYR